MVSMSGNNTGDNSSSVAGGSMRASQRCAPDGERVVPPVLCRHWAVVMTRSSTKEWQQLGKEKVCVCGGGWGLVMGWLCNFYDRGESEFHQFCAGGIEHGIGNFAAKQWKMYGIITGSRVLLPPRDRCMIRWWTTRLTYLTFSMYSLHSKL